MEDSIEKLVEGHPLMEPLWQQRKDKLREDNKVLQELYKHRMQMAPHQKDRQGGQLLLRSIAEIEILIDAYILKRRQIEQLKTDCDNLRQLLKEECAEDTAIRKLAMPIIGEQKAEGDSNGVPTITDVVEEVIKSLLASCNLAEDVRLQETRLKIEAEEANDNLHTILGQKRTRIKELKLEAQLAKKEAWTPTTEEGRLVLEAVTDLAERLRYAFENLPYPDTLTGNSEYDKARIALGIELDKCKPKKPENQ
jgi:hypothetical protein